jgi:hypothetical protein
VTRDMLGRSMDASPDEWLDRLVTERAIDEVRQECAAGPARARATASARYAGAIRRARVTWLGALRSALSRFVPPRVQPLFWRGGDQEG